MVRLTLAQEERKNIYMWFLRNAVCLFMKKEE